MAPVHRAPPPSDPPAGTVDLYEENSEVRQRDTAAATSDEPSRPSEHGDSQAERPDMELATSTARMDHKLRVARILLSQMLPTDSRTRLLQIAIVRRDEALLDGIFGALSRSEEKSPITELAGSIARRRRFSSQVRLRTPDGVSAPKGKRRSTLPPPPRDDSEGSKNR